MKPETAASNIEWEEKLEHFIPVSKYDLLAELERFEEQAEKNLNILNFFPKLEAWRHLHYYHLLNKLKEYYLPFSPDSDMLRVPDMDEEKLQDFQREFVDRISGVLIQANYKRIDHDELNKLMSEQSAWGLDLFVDMSEYEESLIFFRGKMKEKRYYRSPFSYLWLKKIEYEEIVFSRLFILLKMKPEEQRIHELMQENDTTEKKARKILRKKRQNLPDDEGGRNIYLKVFKQLPQSDFEMMFPNTEVRIKLFDKIKLGVTASGGALTGLMGLFSKVALIATNPVGFVVAVGGFIGLLARQVMSFLNTRNKYMLELSQRLFFHSLADNNAALTLMTDRGEEEDIKEDILFYLFLSYYPVERKNITELDERIENFLHERFEPIQLDFEITDPLQRLTKDGLIREDEQGWLSALAPAQASEVLESKFQRLLELQAEGLAAD